METDIAWSRKRNPATPPMNTSGRKTTQVVKTELSIGPSTSVVPFMTDSRRLPLRIHRPVMLSTSTTVLSVIIPTPSRSPESEMMLIDIPIRLKQSIAKTSDTGIDRVTRSGDLKSLMKKTITMHESRIATRMFFRRLLIEYSRRRVWSLVTVNSSCG